MGSLLWAEHVHIYPECRLLSICTFVDIPFHHTMKYTLYSLQLLVTHTHVKLLLIHAICVAPQGWVFYQILSPSAYAPWARTALFRIPLECCKRYGGMLTIGCLPSRSTDSPQQILWYFSSSWVSPRVSLLLLLSSWFLPPFLFSTIMPHNKNNQQCGWIVCLVEYLPGYRQSLMWRVAWHHVCGIW